jgi:ABC-type multidrug transport system fused ATPase/permease subunit
VIETLLGGVFGGLLRLAPEVFKIFDKKNERAHELRMLEAEMEFAKVRGEIAMRQADVQLQTAEIDAMTQAFKEQSETAKNAGWFVSAISALVRPTVTYLFLALYAAVKVAAYLIAIEQGGNWKDVLTSMWGSDDLATFNLVISFWFVGRVYERSRQ